MILQENFTLSNGVSIPKLGLGTWFISDDKAPQAVKDAVALGYRHLDTAQAYGNENGVGQGLRGCGAPRELWLQVGAHRDAIHRPLAESTSAF